MGRLKIQDIPVLYADEWIMAVNKPPGVLSVPGRGTRPTVEGVLRRQGTLDPHAELRVVHRLDIWASGVMVFARSEDAQRILTSRWSRREVEKVYLALVRGHLAGDGEVNLPLLVDRDAGRVVHSERFGKAAKTHYRVLERLMGHTLLECRPVTGRLHQIRVHLAGIGHPLAVDPLYGGGHAIMLSKLKPGYRPNRRGQELPLIWRLSLHAASVRMAHPDDGREMMFEAPLPKDFRATLRQLRRLTDSP